MIRSLFVLSLGIASSFAHAAEPVAAAPYAYGQPSPYASPAPLKAQSQMRLEKTLETHPEILLTLVEMAAQLTEPSVAQKSNVGQAGYSEAARHRNAKSERANNAIFALGTAAVPGLVKLLDDSRPTVRGIALNHLSYAARHPDFPAETVLPALTRIARDDDNPEMREQAQVGLSIAIQLVSHAGFRETISKNFDDQLNNFE